jgi:uncharacterized protein (TIGR03435 family)
MADARWSARLSFSVLVCACALLVAQQLSGQAPSQAPPPPPPSPPVGAAAPGAPAASPLLTPPLPIGTPLEELPRFEVASVKKFEGRVTSSALRTPGGGRITIVNLPLRTIIMQAFGGLRDYQMSGGPGWLTTDRFTITAKADYNAPRDQLLLMMRALLVERFQLKYRVEKREMQAYVLTVAEPPWKPTPRMRQVDCSGARGAKPPSAPFRPDQQCSGGIMLSTSGIQARGTTIPSFVSLLGSIGGLGLIHDRTGLTGTYQIELDASPTALLRSTALLSGLNPSAPDNLLPNVGDGRSLDSAVRDLGLKLGRQKEQVEVLVIDSVSQPDED